MSTFSTWLGSLPTLAFWLFAYTALWVLLTDNAGWSFGVPTVCFASLLAVYLDLRPWRFRLAALPSFLIFFVRFALLGATDVARRSLHRSCPIAPAWVRYRLSIPDPRERLILSAMVGLFPGTLASRVQNDELHLHILDETADWQSAIVGLEQRFKQLRSPGRGARGSKGVQR